MAGETIEADVIDACNALALEATGVDESAVSSTSARLNKPNGGPDDSDEWFATGTLTTAYGSDSLREVPYSCTSYMNSAGDEIDGRVSVKS